MEAERPSETSATINQTGLQFITAALMKIQDLLFAVPYRMLDSENRGTTTV